MKRFFSLLLISALVVTAASCGKNGSEETTKAPDPTGMSRKINSSTVVDIENSSDEALQLIFKGEAGGNTPTGLVPLPEISFKATENTKGLSEKKLSHSHGPSVGGKVHFTVEEFQKTFEKYGGFTFDSKSEEKVVYLTFDCGYEYEGLTGKILDTLKGKKVPAAFFCTLDYLESEPEFVARMINEGHIVGNHSASHPSFAEISREKMAKELETFENYLRSNFGYASRFFRFPAGEYTESALQLVQSLDFVSVFWSAAYDDWDTAKVRGKDYATEKVMSRLHDGAVILLHAVSKDNADALGGIIDKIRGEGYEFRALTEYGT
ncbi:MAG: polysaccharide deacetylase family protein [Clostridia bacterium]|nr:polysaccharide deacetylase family protein [Clostridia bacterium]